MNEEQLKKDMALFNNAIERALKEFPEHKVKEFTFTALEQQMLAEQDTIVALAERTKLKILNELAVKRVGIMPNPSIKLRYHVGLGRFVVFTPKLPKIQPPKIVKS